MVNSRERPIKEAKVVNARDGLDVLADVQVGQL